MFSIFTDIHIANFIHLCTAEFNERQLNTVNINQVNNIQRFSGIVDA